MALDAGWAVRAMHRSPCPEVEGVERCLGDIGDIALLRKASEGITAIVHAAGLAHIFGANAEEYASFREVNEAGTLNVVDTALESGVPHIVLISSVSVYGKYPGVKCDETINCQPQGPYAISKRQGELRAIERVARERASLTILRFATVYGEGDPGNVAKLIDAIDRGYFVWPGSGNNQKSLIYKEDAARACLCALECPVSGTEIFNVSAPPATMREIVTAICQGLGRPVPRLRIPLSLLNAAGTISRKIGDPGNLDKRLEKFIRDDVYDGTKFESAFGFFPTVSLSDGMRRQIDYLRANE